MENSAQNNFLIKLYHYPHCPFCLRVRFFLQALSVAFQDIALAYHDESTPIKLCGKKMLPILSYKNSHEEITIQESKDIIELLINRLNPNQLSQLEDFSNDPWKDVWMVENLVQNLSSTLYSLAMPYWVLLPEFSHSSSRYFQSKKEASRGLFQDLRKKRYLHGDKISASLETFLKHSLIDRQKKVQKPSLADIFFAAHFFGLFFVPGFQFGPLAYQYLRYLELRLNLEYDWYMPMVK